MKVGDRVIYNGVRLYIALIEDYSHKVYLTKFTFLIGLTHGSHTCAPYKDILPSPVEGDLVQIKESTDWWKVGAAHGMDQFLITSISRKFHAKAIHPDMICRVNNLQFKKELMDRRVDKTPIEIYPNADMIKRDEFEPETKASPDVAPTITEPAHPIFSALNKLEESILHE